MPDAAIRPRTAQTLRCKRRAQDAGAGDAGEDGGKDGGGGSAGSTAR